MTIIIISSFIIIVILNSFYFKIESYFLIMFLALLPSGAVSLISDFFDQKLNSSLYVSLIFYAIFASITFFLVIPQEFGGAKPRYVSLDINSAQFSADTLKYLGLSDIDISQSTNPIMMLYSNSDYIVAKAIDSSDAVTLQNRYISSVRAVGDKELKRYTDELAESDSYLKKRNAEIFCELISAPHLSICSTPIPLRHFTD